MGEDLQDERYDSFDEYRYNDDIYKDARINVGDLGNSFPDDIIPRDTNERESIIMDCLRLKKYIMEFENKEPCQNKNCCAYINYMLNKWARSYKTSHKSIFEYYISYINHHSNDAIKNTCGPKIKHMDKDEYEKIEKLSTTYELYKLFISDTDGTGCSIAKNCSRAYNDIIITYTQVDDAKYCKALEDFKNVFEANVKILTGECHSEIENLLPYPDECNQLLQKLEHETALSDQQKGRLAEQEESGRSTDIQRDHLGDVPDDNTISPSSFGTTLPITLFSSGIGVLLAFLSFYKFTPLGHCLKLIKHRFGGIPKNIDKEEYEIQLDSSEYDGKNSEYNEYNIAYNSF
ncbi:PIR protein [Plasmodium ovale]|uniref:PIR protein n=1 Tax=Plasmodium ovale TaxID=36330 RepID=A0A1C3KM57_PLAOA|nr:PIR protein [Plasmodium ovale]